MTAGMGASARPEKIVLEDLARNAKFSGNWMNRFLDVVEKGGNVLPYPATLFALMALSVIVLSGIAAMFDISAIHPGTGETIKPVSLLSGDGLRRITSAAVCCIRLF